MTFGIEGQARRRPESSGVTADMVRLSVGIEYVEGLLEYLEQALT